MEGEIAEVPYTDAESDAIEASLPNDVKDFDDLPDDVKEAIYAKLGIKPAVGGPMSDPRQTQLLFRSGKELRLAKRQHERNVARAAKKARKR